MTRRKLLFWAGLCLVLALWALPVSAITWGEPDTAHVNVGAMVYNHPEYGPYQVCSGTLIHPRVFLTAGHCTDGWDPDAQIWVNFDAYALNEDTLLDVAEIITHPDYGWEQTSNPHDVGVLVLAEPVVGIEPVAWPPPEGLLDQLKADGLLNNGPLGGDGDPIEGPHKALFTLVGYGGTLDWPPPDIYYEDYRQVAYSEYRSLPGPWLHMSQNPNLGNGGTCFGDSGGPAFWVDPETGAETIVGVTSWGDAQCVASSFNYRVDIPETLTFVQGVIDSLE